MNGVRHGTPAFNEFTPQHMRKRVRGANTYYYIPDRGDQALAAVRRGWRRLMPVQELADMQGADLKTHKVVTAALLVNEWGKRLTKPALRNQFVIAGKAAANAHPELASAIEKFRFYDLRAKAADDTSDERDEQAASDLLGHVNVKTTQRHYLRRGRIVPATK